MFDRLRKDPCLCIFTVMTLIQSLLCALWAFGRGRELLSLHFAAGLALMCGCLFFAAWAFGISRLYVLYVISSPFVFVTAAELPKVTVITALSAALCGLVFLLWQKRRRGVAALVIAVAAVIFSCALIITSAGSLKNAATAYPYLLFEKTAWPHLMEHGFDHAPDLFADNEEIIREADLNPYRLRAELKPVIDRAFGEKASAYYLDTAVYFLKIGTGTAVWETLVRIILILSAPLSVFAALVFRIPDTLVTAFVLDIASVPFIARLWLSVAFAGIVAMAAGSLLKAHMAGRLIRTLKSRMRLLAVTVPVALFIFGYSVPAFDVRVTGIVFIMVAAFWTKAFTDTTDGKIN